MSVNTKLVAVPEADTRWRAYPRKGKLGLSGLPLSQERVKEENADRIWRRALFGNKPDGTQGRGLLPVLYDAGSATAQTFLLKQQAQNPDLATATSVGGVSMSTWSGIRLLAGNTHSVKPIDVVSGLKVNRFLDNRWRLMSRSTLSV